MTREAGSDLLASTAATALFGVSLGIATVSLPLLAIASGYGPSEVGLFAAASAVAQMSCRPFVGSLLRRFADRWIAGGAAALLAGSAVLVAVSAEVAAFVVAALLQGAARALFWTASQTHAVRGPRSSLSALAQLNLVASLGALLGPLAAGFLAARWGLQVALAVAAVLAVVGLAPVGLLARYPVFGTRDRDRPGGTLWRRPVLRPLLWGTAAGGAWWGITASYLPVILVQGGRSDLVVGVLVAVGNGAATLGSWLAGRLPARLLPPAVAAAVLTCGASLLVVAVLPGVVAVVALALAWSGAAAGALQTLCPARASEVVEPDERGDAIAAAGTFRAGALFAGPLAMAGLVLVLPVAPALGIAGAVIALPTLLSRARRA